MCQLHSVTPKVLPVDSVHNLGYFMDRMLKNSAHINKLTSGSYYQLRNVKKICDKLDLESAKNCGTSFGYVKTRLFQLLLLGLPEYQLVKLQKIQNMACRVVTNLDKYDHISASMKDLHWLKVKHCIDFKIATLMHNCKTSNAPQYLMDLFPNKQSQRTLRSSTTEFTPSIYCKTLLAYNSAFPSAAQESGTVYHLLSDVKRTKHYSGRNYRPSTSVSATSRTFTIFVPVTMNTLLRKSLACL